MPRLLPSLAAAHMLGIALADRGVVSPRAALALGLAALVAGALAARRARVRFAAALLLAAAAGAFALGSRLEAAARHRPAQPVECTLEGSVQHVAVGPTWALIDLVDVAAVGAGDPPLPERVRLRGEPAPEGLPALERQLPGARVRVRARLRAPRELRNPGARSRLRRLERAGIGAEGRLLHPALHVRMPGHEGWRPLAWLHVRRSAWSERMAAAGPGSGLLRALALGDRGGMSVAARDDFARLGIAHLLAVSGLHIAAVASLVFAAFRAAAGRSAALAARLDTRALALAAGVLAALVYAALAGWDVPVRRALALLLGLAAAFAGRRRRAALPPLAASALAVLAQEPQALFEPGPQLSFAASLALVAAVRRTPSATRERAPRGARALRASASAVAVTAPLVALHLGTVAPFALLVNLVAIPWTACALLPAAGLALVAAALPAGPASETLLAWAAAPARGTEVAAGLLAARLPGPTIAGQPGWLGWCAIAALVALSLAARRTRSRVALAAAVTCVVAFAPPAPLAPAAPRLVFLEVGQGDASVVQTRSAAVLIDAATAIPGGGDLGARVVVPALRALGIRALDLVVVTHGDLDHRGGVPAVLRALPVAELWVPHGARAAPAFEAVFAAARARGIPIRERGTGSPPAQLGDLRVTPLWPPPSAATPGSRNDRSLVVRIDVAGRRVLLPGDIEAAAEAALLVSGADLKADVLKLAHHGSRTSSSDAFLAAVDADLAVASAPCGGRFGMPHAEVSDRARARDLSLWWTGRDGAVMVGLGGPLAVWGFAPVAEMAPICRGGSARGRVRYDANATGMVPVALDGVPAA